MLSEPEYGFVFVHVPKTGGTSITVALDGYRHHWTPGDLKWWDAYLSASDPHVFRAVNGGHPRLPDYIAFIEAHGYPIPKVYTIVRNPWDKVVSGYHFHQGHPPGMEFGPWMEWSYNMWKTDPIESKMWHQHYFLGDYPGYPIRVLRFEDGGPPQALNTMRDELGLDRIAPLEHHYKSIRRPYREYFSDQRHVDMIAEVFKVDIEMFGYDF